MTPYYSDDFVTIYHGDCRQIDAWLTADVMVTDPPYGIGWTTHGVSRTSTADKRRGDYNGVARPVKSIANDSTTEVRDQALRLWGDRPAFVFGSLLLPPPAGVRNVGAYVKPSDAGALSGVAYLRRDVEAIYVLGKSAEWERKKSERTRESIPQSQRQPSPWRSACFRTTWARVGGTDGLAAASGHPHAKPVDVLSQLIVLHSGVVADPFMGSGSTLRAAKDLGRKAIGIELEERYCELAARRMSQEVLQFGDAS